MQEGVKDTKLAKIIMSLELLALSLSTSVGLVNEWIAERKLGMFEPSEGEDLAGRRRPSALRPAVPVGIVKANAIKVKPPLPSVSVALRLKVEADEAVEAFPRGLE
ncbi:hypothetical protein DFJ73DRAFT_768114 [Zopfochytrium polystomum]|nr:hypothetical protein DFJ73DRAFT_768114 [Zopfochytrium polystomum]